VQEEKIQIMGSNNSRLKLKETKSKSHLIPNQLSEIVNEKKELAFYLSNNDIDDVDRQHTHNFLIKYIFRGNFSAPVEKKLNLGCKVLDVA
jgi:hypothetical protein